MEKLSKFLIIASMFCLLTVVCGLYTISYAEIPKLLNYQGKLTDQQNKPVTDGSYSVTFRIYDAETAGNLLWEETQQVTVSKGIFSVLLGGVTPLNIGFDKPYFLEIKVGTEVMSPRQRVASAAYAFRADTADSLPSGVLLLCKNQCPIGYKRVGSLDGKFLVGGSEYNPAAGGSNQHKHSIPYTGWPNASGSALPTGSGTLQTFAQSGYDEHATGNKLSGEADSRPEFATIVICEKE